MKKKYNKIFQDAYSVRIHEKIQVNICPCGIPCPQI